MALFYVSKPLICPSFTRISHSPYLQPILVPIWSNVEKNGPYSDESDRYMTISVTLDEKVKFDIFGVILPPKKLSADHLILSAAQD